ncbi:hypothetical protein V5O48_003714 [Marasmius crinis-equi]|uniref:MYND-type domain-containing protein n=1 Tax=Marasmius crinis-equi TaxID=585013 RepID=A0ABR3FS33_9AGAR
MSSTNEYPSAIRCIYGLRDLGAPPANIDFTEPTSKIQAAFRIFTSLALHIGNDRSATRHIRVYWLNILSVWVQFIFQKIILAPERPLQDDPFHFFEQSVDNICEFLLLTEGDTRFIENTTPGLMHALIQGWYLLIHLKHTSLHAWSLVLCNFVQLKPLLPPPSTTLFSPTLYHENSTLGQIFVDQFKRHVRTLRSTTVQNLRAIHTFLMLLSKISLSPMLQERNAVSTLKLVARLTGILLLTRGRRLQIGTVDSEIYRDARGVILMSYNIVLLCMHHPFRMYQLLRNGFMTYMMCADLRYFHVDRITSGLRPEGTVAYLSTEIIKQFSRFLVYPELLRCFIRRTRKIQLERNAFVDVGAEDLWNAWFNANQKAAAFYGLYQDVKRRATLCSYIKCRLTNASPERCQEAHYLRCLGCKSVMYCSHECRRADWRLEHGKKCSQVASDKKNGHSPLRRDDLRFFAYLLEDHLRRFATVITQHISSSFVAFNGYSYENMFFPIGPRKPILFVTFDTPKSPQETDARILSPAILNEWVETGYFGGSTWIPSTLQKWTEIQPTEILVITAFPRSQGTAWPYVAVVDFPLEEDLRFDLDLSDLGTFL